MGFVNSLGNWLERRAALAQPWRELRYVAVDLEMSGLNPEQDELLALAWINIQPPLMDYGSAQYHLLGRSGRQLPDLKQSPVVHGLMERDFLNSSEPKQTLRMLSRVLNDAVLVCHHVQLDWQFLQTAARKYDIPLKPLGFFDTLQFEHQRLQRQQEPLGRDQLTLGACRKRYKLPTYSNHHAFADALGCGELFLAQAYQFGGAENLTTRRLLRAGG